MNLKIVFFIAACIVVINADPWGDYKKKFGKKFKNKNEEERRYKLINALEK
jgi:hypothetical protein